jgi:hypothetical protein
MSALTGYEEERRELERVLRSEAFVRAPGLANFLTYISEKYFQGQADQIKEYSIAVEAFGRPPDFNQKQDSVVRVEAHRLRKRLREYYETDGADHPIQIAIPPGQYVPQFVVRGGPAAEEPSPNGTTSLTVVPDAGVEEAGVPDMGTAPRFSIQRRLLVILLAGLLLAALGSIWWRTGKGKGQPPVPVSPAAGVPSDTIRIQCGSTDGLYVDHLGNTWLADRYFQGGTIVTTPPHRIAQTADPAIFRTRREGQEFSYAIPLQPGRHELHLYFSEPVFGEDNVAGGGETSRIFQVFINGKLLLDGLDVTSDAGGANIANEKVFTGITAASDGKLHLRFRSVKENAILNGIALLPAPSGKPLPVRIVARDLRYTDQSGRVWLPDRYFTRGQTVLRPEPIAGTSDPELYRGERFGHFTYTLPLAPGRYAVRLRFNEAWFGPGRPGGGGAGSRVFDVFANGVALLRNFDLFQAAGGANRALEKVFHGLEPNAQGKIVLSFVPVRNYASVNAIEVAPEPN